MHATLLITSSRLVFLVNMEGFLERNAVIGCCSFRVLPTFTFVSVYTADSLRRLLMPHQPLAPCFHSVPKAYNVDLLRIEKKPSNRHEQAWQASDSKGTLASRLKSEKGIQGSKNKTSRMKATLAVKGTLTPGQICLQEQ